MKEWIIRKFNNWFQKQLEYWLEMNPRLVGSNLRMMKADIRCLKGNHEWQEWSATACGNVAQIKALKSNHYSYRSCRHCGIEMPESRIYHEKGIKEKSAKTFKETNTPPLKQKQR